MFKKTKKKSMCFVLCCILIFLFVCSGCVQLTKSYVPERFLVGGWHENSAFHSTGVQLFGFEKWISVTYELNSRYPAFLTITTVKTLILSNEDDLFSQTKTMIEQTFHQSLTIVNQSEGERSNSNNHHTRFVIYTGVIQATNETVYIIGEIWNCAVTGSAVICVGNAYITNAKYPGQKNTDNWQMLVSDPSGTIDGYQGETGLLYNVWCH